MAGTGNIQNLNPWQPGQSGNPSGRPADVREWRERCRKFMMEDGGLDILIALATNKGSDQMKALQFIGEHGMGKAVQQIAGADEDFEKLKIVIERTPVQNSATDGRVPIKELEKR